MKKTFVTIYSIFASIVLLFAIAYLLLTYFTLSRIGKNGF